MAPVATAWGPLTNVTAVFWAVVLPAPCPIGQRVGMANLTQAARTKAVDLNAVSKAFGAIHAVRRVDLAIEAGETIALLGPNGAGKSTTIDMLLGLTEPDGGMVSIYGLSPAAAVAAGKVGAMPQTGSLLRDLTVRELIAMMASLYPKPLAVDTVLEMTGSTGIADRRTQKLSGGETQRVRFGIAVVSNPDLLVLDEPTVALDVAARHSFWETMRRFTTTGRTVLFATHYLEEADAFADRIVLMAGGRVVADGPTTEIKARVGMRTIRATVPGVSAAALGALPGAGSVRRNGDVITLVTADSDRALRSLLATYPQARDIEVRGAGLEEVFLELTASGKESL